MVKMEDAVIARFEHAGHRFEVLVDPDLALELKKGAKINLENLLAFEAIYKDAKKGEEASTELVEKTFGTGNVLEVAQKIVLEGEVQLTTEQRKRMVEHRRKEIIMFISRNGINPQTNAPHPEQRIENALNELRFQVDLFKPLQEQVEDALKGIKRLIPISMEKLKLALKIPAEFSGRATTILHKFGCQKMEWQNDGSLVGIVELPAGMKQDLFNELNHLTKGQLESKIL
ncbi:MAG: ribosome assembly factor SBDS [Candidatus Diapherotrites archaeon]